MTATAYLAGPDVFPPSAVAHAAKKVEICRRLGLRGLSPLNEHAETAATELEVWQAIYEKDVAMMENSDIIIANLTPFLGASADAGRRRPISSRKDRGCRHCPLIPMPPKDSYRI